MCFPILILTYHLVIICQEVGERPCSSYTRIMQMATSGKQDFEPPECLANIKSHSKVFASVGCRTSSWKHARPRVGEESLEDVSVAGSVM